MTALANGYLSALLAANIRTRHRALIGCINLITSEEVDRVGGSLRLAVVSGASIVILFLSFHGSRT